MTVYEFDTIIVGSGPSGLTFAQCSAFVNKNVLIIEKDSSIGGLHRVRYVNGLFSEHGPRIYSSAYVNFRYLLQKMSSNFHSYFTPYDFQMLTLGNQSISNFNATEIIAFIIAFIQLTVSSQHGTTISMYEWMRRNNFSSIAMDYVDRACRLTDGATMHRYSLNKFLSIINQQGLYSLYQPLVSNNDGFLSTWKDYLLSTGTIQFKMNTSIYSIQSNEDQVVSIKDTIGNTFYAKTFVFAIPPMSLVPILEHSGISSIQQFKQFALNTRYITYISISYQWVHKIHLPKVWGFPKSEWGVVFVILSDYIKNVSGTLISTAITITDSISSFTHKTANNSSKEELIQETFRQLSISFPSMPPYDTSVLSPSLYRENGKWKDIDESFVNTPNTDSIPFRIQNFENLYTVGTQNGFERYNFTSLESAVTNALELAHALYPETMYEFPIFSPLQVTDVIRFILVLIILYYIYNYYYKR